MKQSLITRKNRKIRKFRERYPGHQGQALHTARLRAAGSEIRPEPRHVEDPRPGEVYLSRDEIRPRVDELGAEIGRDYAGRDLVLVTVLKGAFIFAADLARATPIPHAMDFLVPRRLRRRPRRPLAASGCSRTSTCPITGRDVLLVENVVDTGLTLNYVVKTLALRDPAGTSRSARSSTGPYRRLVDDLPMRYVGFTVPGPVLRGLRLRPARALPRPARTSTSPSSLAPRRRGRQTWPCERARRASSASPSS